LTRTVCRYGDSRLGLDLSPCLVTQKNKTLELKVSGGATTLGKALELEIKQEKLKR
jgi:hypothetical protein